MQVSSGGTASSITLTSGTIGVDCYGRLYDATLSGGSLMAYGGSLNNVTVNGGWLHLYASATGGGTITSANSVTINNGGAYLFMATVNNLTIGAGGDVYAYGSSFMTIPNACGTVRSVTVYGKLRRQRHVRRQPAG